MKKSENTIVMHRQGDVLLADFETRHLLEGHILPDARDMWHLEITDFKATATARPSNIVVEGEVTGHAHRLLSGQVLEAAQQLLYLDILMHTQVVHEEHRAISLEPGMYQVIRQREYSPEAIRLVID